MFKRRALVASLGAYRHRSDAKRLHESGIEQSVIRRKYLGLCHLYKIIHSPIYPYLKQLLLPFVGQCTQYSLCGGDNFSIPQTKKLYTNNSFFRLDGIRWLEQAGPEYFSIQYFASYVHYLNYRTHIRKRQAKHLFITQECDGSQCIKCSET